MKFIKVTSGSAASTPAATIFTSLKQVNPVRESGIDGKVCPREYVIQMREVERIKEAQNTAEMRTGFNDIDMSPLLDLRVEHKDESGPYPWHAQDSDAHYCRR